MRCRSAGLALLHLTLVWAPGRAQQPSKQINPVPLARPDLLVTLPGRTADSLLNHLKGVLTASGFTLTKSDQDALLLDGKRPEAMPSKDYDRVLIWLQCHPMKSRRFDVYLLYGRYEEIIARQVGVFRVVVDEQFEDEHVGALKRWIIALADSLGGHP